MLEKNEAGSEWIQMGKVIPLERGGKEKGKKKKSQFKGVNSPHDPHPF